MKVTVSLDDMWTDDDWDRSVTEIIREEIQAAVRKEIKILVRSYVSSRRDLVVQAADEEAKKLLKGVKL